MLALLLLLTATADDAALIARSTALTRAEQRCAADATGTDITVCGRRRADRYRVPLVVHDPGDPRYESVGAERARLLHHTTPIQDLSPFLVGGGLAGVSVRRSFGGPGGGETSAGGYRPLAP